MIRLGSVSSCARWIGFAVLFGIAAPARANDTCVFSGTVTLNGSAPATGTPGRCLDNYTNPSFTTGNGGAYTCTVQEGGVTLELNGASDGPCPRACLTPPGTETCNAAITTSAGCQNATVMFSLCMVPSTVLAPKIRKRLRRWLGR